MVVGHPTRNRKGSVMSPKQQFALALRIIGVLGIIYVMRAFIRAPSPETYVLVARIVCVLVGAWMIRGASLLVNLAYPEPEHEHSDADKEESKAVHV